PEAPTRNTKSPSGMTRSTSRSADLPFGNVIVTLFSTRTGRRRPPARLGTRPSAVPGSPAALPPSRAWAERRLRKGARVKLVSADRSGREVVRGRLADSDRGHDVEPRTPARLHPVTGGGNRPANSVPMALWSGRPR